MTSDLERLMQRQIPLDKKPEEVVFEALRPVEVAPVCVRSLRPRPKLTSVQRRLLQEIEDAGVEGIRAFAVDSEWRVYAQLLRKGVIVVWENRYYTVDALAKAKEGING